MSNPSDSEKDSPDYAVQGWEAIAVVLGCSMRTAQRWAVSGRFSVYKVPGTKPPRVCARSVELEKWQDRTRSPWRAELGAAGFGSEAHSDAIAPHEHLWGWKTIARLLKVSIRTVQRWEHEAKLPVHRLLTGRRAFPYAFGNELSAWVKERTVNRPSASVFDISRQKLPPLLQSFLDAMTAPIAVLDRSGTIISVNKAWRTFAKANGYREPDLGIGRNYFKDCGSAACLDPAIISRVAIGLGELLAGRRQDWKVKYRGQGRAKKRDFLLSATRLEGSPSPFLVLSHLDVTNVL